VAWVVHHQPRWLLHEADAYRRPLLASHSIQEWEEKMRLHFIPVLMLTAAFMAGVPAVATDTSSLNAFVVSCKEDAKGCHTLTLNAILSARAAKYGCIPKDLDNDAAADKLLTWLKETANPNPKYQKDALSDLFWTGVDEIWPCKK
jgi:glycosyltransferase involved in cell wall biosynthesis